MEEKELKCVHNLPIILGESHVEILCDECGSIMRQVFSHLFLIHNMKVAVTTRQEKQDGEFNGRCMP